MMWPIYEQCRLPGFGLSRLVDWQTCEFAVAMAKLLVPIRLGRDGPGLEVRGKECVLKPRWSNSYSIHL